MLIASSSRRAARPTTWYSDCRNKQVKKSVLLLLQSQASASLQYFSLLGLHVSALTKFSRRSNTRKSWNCGRQLARSETRSKARRSNMKRGSKRWVLNYSHSRNPPVRPHRHTDKSKRPESHPTKECARACVRCINIEPNYYYCPITLVMS
jgi:hypothetical protein